MRIGIFTDTYPPFINGVSTSIAMLEKALRKKGHEVFIVTVNPENMKYEYEDEDRVIRIPGIPIGIYDYRLTGIYPIRAINKIKSWNLDIIHSHTEFGIGTFARIIAKQLDIPLVHTYHTMYEDYVHYITHGHFDKSSKKAVEYFTKFYCDKTAKELIVPSKKAYDLFKQKYQVDKDVRIVPTGIEVERFFKENFKESEIKELRKELGIKDDDFVILTVGRLAEEKRIDLLIKQHVQILKHNKNAKLLIIGGGPDYETYLELVKKIKITKNVILTNAIPWEQMPKYYQLGTVFASASITETQGLTIVEAMAASKPTVVARDEAFSGTVIDNLNGYLFETEDQYVEGILRLMKDKQKLKEMSNQARFTSEAHSLKYYAENILDVYANCLRKVKREKTFVDKIRDKIKEKLG